MTTLTRPTEPRTRSFQDARAEIRPASLSCRDAHQLAAPIAHVTYVTSHRQCYISAPASTRHSSRVTSPAKFNRQPRRLEFTVSRTKQTPAPQFNRQLSATSPKSLNTLNLPTNFLATRHSSLATASFPPHAISNRHTPRLENAISHRKQTLDTRSNRHFLHVSASHQLQTANAHNPTHNVSNRQWQIRKRRKPLKTNDSTPF
jgi:hypothetical protein